MCVMCRRTLLAGERFRLWRSLREHDRPVCALCERTAAKAGWARLARPAERENAVGALWRVRRVA